ncbi:MAG: ABC transporter ATP-binding protein [Planctomycetes bacterium]|nr:ABC transporter ATP-binding protein [Planctomycetota bacterium]
MTEVLLSTDGLEKRFGKLVVVRDLSMTVRAGDVYGLLGLNGAGKTTTLRMVLGLVRPTAGEVVIMGRRVRFGAAASRREVGAFIEGPAFFGQLSALENLLSLSRLTDPIARGVAQELLVEVGLGEAMNRPVRTFSFGMKQRLGIALALAPDPRLIILDEPTNGLDPKGIRDVRDLILRLNAERGLTFVISSHLLHEVENLCTQVGIVHEHTLAREGPLDALMKEGASELRIVAEPVEVAQRVIEAHAGPDDYRVDEGGFLVQARNVDPASLNRALIEAGASVSVLSPRRPSLEELFLARTEEVAS